MTAQELSARLGIGYNLGNTFDATGGNREDIYSQEQSWGNAIADEAMICRVKAAGFTSIRIPITWFPQMDADYTVNPAFLARIREVIDLCYKHELPVIINVHHEAWLNHANLAADRVKIGQQLTALWRQIVDYFAGDDHRLLFETMNEPRLAGTPVEWTGNQDGFDAVNYLNQLVVETIRSNPKGYNSDRWLLVPGYAASSNRPVMEAIKLPTLGDEPVSNLIVSVHGYTPYDFCLSDNWTDFDPANEAHTGPIDVMFANMKELFLSRGIPVILGETGATNTGNNHAARARWARYIGRKAAAYGVPLFIWDNGVQGTEDGECHAWVYRRSEEAANGPCVVPAVVDALMEGAASVAWGTELG